MAAAASSEISEDHGHVAVTSRMQAPARGNNVLVVLPISTSLQGQLTSTGHAKMSTLLQTHNVY